MNIAKIKATDISNGPGVRVSLFVSGCRHACKGCFNKEIWSFKKGDLYSDTHFNELYNLLNNSYISGLSLLGGEPLDPLNVYGIYDIISKLKEKIPNLNIWCYSGYTYEYLINEMAKEHPIVLDVLKLCNVLVDGKFEIDKLDLKLKFRGSSNQRLIDLTKSTINNVVLVDI